jgi:hypothetical protein
MSPRWRCPNNSARPSEWPSNLVLVVVHRSLQGRQSIHRNKGRVKPDDGCCRGKKRTGARASLGTASDGSSLWAVAGWTPLGKLACALCAGKWNRRRDAQRGKRSERYMKRGGK